MAVFSLSSVRARDSCVSVAKVTPWPAAARMKPVLAVMVTTRRESPVAKMARDRLFIFPGKENEKRKFYFAPIVWKKTISVRTIQKNNTDSLGISFQEVDNQ